MRIAELQAQPNWVLSIVADDGRVGRFDVSPYLQYEAFEALRDHSEFAKVVNGGYFVEWDCGADLSADTIEARWEVFQVASFTNMVKVDGKFRGIERASLPLVTSPFCAQLQHGHAPYSPISLRASVRI